MRPFIPLFVLAPTVVVLFALPASLHAQNAPKRPRLVAGADTNAASAYYAQGLRLIQIQPRGAADAFFWAAQLDPTGNP